VPWGRPRDLEFLRTDDCEGFGKEELEPHEIFSKFEGNAADKPLCVKMLRHYNPVIRSIAAHRLGKMGDIAEITKALVVPR